MTTELTWTGTPDDMTARSGEYVLRIRNIGAFVFYYEWSVATFNFKETGNSFLIEEAKAAAINAMKEHLNKK